MVEFVGSESGLFDILDESDDAGDDGLEDVVAAVEEDAATSDADSEEVLYELEDECADDYSVDYALPEDAGDSSAPVEIPDLNDIVYEEYYALEAFLWHNAGELFCDELAERVARYASRLSSISRDLI